MAHRRKKRQGKGSLRFRSDEDVPRQLSIGRHPEIADLDGNDGPFFRHRDLMKRYGNPLKRFLQRQVGRSWSDVEADLDERCRRIKVDRAVQLSIREEVLREVARQVRLDPANGWVDVLTGYRCGLYVNPATGTLRVQPKRYRAEPGAATDGGGKYAFLDSEPSTPRRC
jgi:hypothetical protein